MPPSSSPHDLKEALARVLAEKARLSEENGQMREENTQMRRENKLLREKIDALLR